MYDKANPVEPPDSVSPEAVAERRRAPEPTTKVAFQLKSLYGFSDHSVKVPLGRDRFVDSGTVALTLDPEAAADGNFGVIDFDRTKLRVRYSVQLMFPGLYDLVKRKEYDSNLLNPARAIATDDCEVSEDYSGWRALGRMDFLPGSLWSGAGGG
ncbi:MAG TPA: hypothetical protein VFY69_03390 [Solirubrobacterales bacterium]|nr:hypothetical protein [Solirubrobacterales bacterium]